MVDEIFFLRKGPPDFTLRLPDHITFPPIFRRCGRLFRQCEWLNGVSAGAGGVLAALGGFSAENCGKKPESQFETKRAHTRAGTVGISRGCQERAKLGWAVPLAACVPHGQRGAAAGMGGIAQGPPRQCFCSEQTRFLGSAMEIQTPPTKHRQKKYYCYTITMYIVL